MNHATSRSHRRAAVLLAFLLSVVALWLISGGRDRSDENTAVSAVAFDPSDRALTSEADSASARAAETGLEAGWRGHAPDNQAQSHLPSTRTKAAVAMGVAISKRAWESDFFTSRSNAAAGMPIGFQLTDGVMAAGTIRRVEHSDGELTYVSGELSEPEQGRFFFQKQTFPGKQGAFAGVVELPQSKRAWRVEPSGPNGKSELIERRQGEVICVLPRRTAA